MEMINRFRSAEGQNRLITVLRQQVILHNNEPLVILEADSKKLSGGLNTIKNNRR